MTKQRHIETDLAHMGEARKEHHGAVVPPMYRNSLFTFEDWDAIDYAFDHRTEVPIYSRLSNPTLRLAEDKIARLAGGESARLFASGMAAISAAVLHFCNAGDHVIAVRNVYGPANNLLNRYLADKMNLDVTFVQGESILDFADAIRNNTRLIYLESPSSAVFGLQDVRAIAELAKKEGIPTLMDNTWATPLFQKPMEMGIDLEMHSCSKYLGGHSDLVSGVLIGSRHLISEISTEEGELLGGILSPADAWLLTRSLRTLPMRMKQHAASGGAVAAFLEAHPRVRRVRYPGLTSHPQYALGSRQMSGYTGLMGFELDTNEPDRIKAFVDRLEIFLLGVSWGGHESLVYAPAISYLKELPPDQFASLGISMGDIRISVGLENVEDLISDLSRALEVV